MVIETLSVLPKLQEIRLHNVYQRLPDGVVGAPLSNLPCVDWTLPFIHMFGPYDPTLNSIKRPAIPFPSLVYLIFDDDIMSPRVLKLEKWMACYRSTAMGVPNIHVCSWGHGTMCERRCERENERKREVVSSLLNPESDGDSVDSGMTAKRQDSTEGYTLQWGGGLEVSNQIPEDTEETMSNILELGRAWYPVFRTICEVSVTDNEWQR